MNGSNMKNFESHLANIVMRNHNVKRNRYDGFFDMLQSIYTLQGPPVYTYKHPLFDTWSVDSTDDDTMDYSIHRLDTDDDASDTPSTLQLLPALVQQPLHPGVTYRKSATATVTSADAVDDAAAVSRSPIDSTPESPVLQAAPYKVPTARQPAVATTSTHSTTHRGSHFNVKCPAGFEPIDLVAKKKSKLSLITKSKKRVLKTPIPELLPALIQPPLHPGVTY